MSEHTLPSQNPPVPQIHSQISLSPTELAAARDQTLIIDVRKPLARAKSGVHIPGSIWRHPFAAADWAEECGGRVVALYCVHGHEVSLAVRGFLADSGVDAFIIEGGIEAWINAGLPVEPMEPLDV